MECRAVEFVNKSLQSNLKMIKSCNLFPVRGNFCFHCKNQHETMRCHFFLLQNVGVEQTKLIQIVGEICEKNNIVVER